jgi:hypothetical protein
MPIGLDVLIALRSRCKFLEGVEADDPVLRLNSV